MVQVPSTMNSVLAGDAAPRRGGKKQVKEESKAAGGDADDETETKASDDGADAEPAAALTLARLSEETGVHASLNRGAGYVSLSGTAPQVVAAKALLEAALVAHAELNAEVKMESWMAPFVVGSKGATINRLQEETGCTLNLDRGRTRISISGTSSDQVQAARQVISSMVTRLAAQRVVIAVSASGIGLIIGRGGATIRSLQVCWCVV